MKRLFLIIGVIGLLCMSTGCTALRENARDIKTIKSHLVTLESALTQQNLYLQQINQRNKDDIEALLDRSDELTFEIERIKKQQELVPKTTPRISQSVRKEKDKEQSAIMSDTFASKPSIRDMQKALRNAGFYKGEIDGNGGPLTRSAVKDFQKSHGLKVDGILGRKTWEKLEGYL